MNLLFFAFIFAVSWGFGQSLCLADFSKLEAGRNCRKPCLENSECVSPLKSCNCDDFCGMSCFNPLAECLEPPGITNGKRILSSGIKYGDVVRYSCHDSYVLKGSSERKCRSDKKWSGIKAECISCGDPPTLENGSVETVSDTEVKYVCDRGYTLPEEQSKGMCVNSRWSNPPKCNIMTCPKPEYVLHAKVQYDEDSYKHKTFKYYTCKSGYKLKKDPSFIYCLTSGEWYGSAECVADGAAGCGEIDLPNNAKASRTTGVAGHTATLTCGQGYKAEGSNIAKCENDNTWTVNFKCVSNSCTYPGSITNGHILASDFNVGTRIKFRCKSGYVLLGEPEATCLETNKWSDFPPICQKITCGKPAIANGYVLQTKNKFEYQGVIDVRCNNGWVIEPSEKTVCSNMNKWEPEVSCKQDIYCTAPNIKNGQVKNRKSKYDVTDPLLFECNLGYAAQNEDRAICGENGDWFVIPFCKKMDKTCWYFKSQISYSASSHMCLKSKCYTPQEASLSGRGWMPDDFEKNKSYLELNFGKLINIGEIQVQGETLPIQTFESSLKDMFVESFQLKIANSASSTFVNYIENGSVKTFSVLHGHDTIGIKFDYGELSAYKIRFIPLKANGYPNMKVGIKEFCD